jgi:DNA-binding MarR family transcriptional regulator
VVYSNKVAYLNTKTVKKDLQKQTKADENEVNKAVALFLSQAKNEVKKSEGQKASSLPETPGKEAEVDQEAEELAEKILNTQDVLKALKEEALDNYLVGEDQNKQLAFILNFSGKYAKVEKKANQIVIFMGSSGVGKSALASLSRFFRTKEVGRFTEHALDYSDLSGFEILYLKELSRADDESQGVATMKFLSTEDQGYIIEYTVKDESGRFTTEEKKIPPITIVTTTTRVYVDSQFERRAWVVNPDESEEQTNRILKFKAKLKEQENEVKLGLRKRTDYDFASAVLRKIVEKVEAKEVVVPYPNALTELLSAKTLRARGDYDKVYTLIPLVALLYQRQLPTLKGKLVATPRICVEALEIGLEPLTTMTTDLDVRIRKVVVALKGKGITKKGDYVKRETRADVAKELGVSEKTVSRYLDQMEEKGYLTSMTDPDDKRRNIHMLMYDVDEILAKASSIQITPELGQQLGHQEMSMSRLENLYYETLQLVAKNCGQNGQVDKENISLLNQLWQEATSYGLDLNMYYQKLNLSQFLEQHETSNRDMDKSGAQNSVQNNTGEEQKSDTPNPPNTPETEGEISSNGGLNNPPESQLKCSSCLSWSKNRCELHPEWAVVTPDHPVCKDYQPKEEKET